jgi:hypothetical protein
VIRPGTVPVDGSVAALGLAERVEYELRVPGRPVLVAFASELLPLVLAVGRLRLIQEPGELFLGQVSHYGESMGPEPVPPGDSGRRRRPDASRRVLADELLDFLDR